MNLIVMSGLGGFYDENIYINIDNISHFISNPDGNTRIYLKTGSTEGQKSILVKENVQEVLLAISKVESLKKD